MGVGGQRHVPAALPPEMTRYPLYRRLGGPQGRSWRVRKISPPQGFDPWTVQPVASRYTDWAIQTLSYQTVQGRGVWTHNPPSTAAFLIFIDVNKQPLNWNELNWIEYVKEP
jgi:hypothetical protein